MAINKAGGLLADDEAVLCKRRCKSACSACGHQLLPAGRCCKTQAGIRADRLREACQFAFPALPRTSARGHVERQWLAHALAWGLEMVLICLPLRGQPGLCTLFPFNPMAIGHLWLSDQGLQAGWLEELRSERSNYIGVYLSRDAEKIQTACFYTLKNGGNCNVSQ